MGRGIDVAAGANETRACRFVLFQSKALSGLNFRLILGKVILQIIRIQGTIRQRCITTGVTSGHLVLKSMLKNHQENVMCFTREQGMPGAAYHVKTIVLLAMSFQQSIFVLLAPQMENELHRVLDCKQQIDNTLSYK